MNPHNAAAIDLARVCLAELKDTLIPGRDVVTVHHERLAAQRALEQIPQCKWSVDQLRARAFNPDCKGMFWSMGRPA